MWIVWIVVGVVIGWQLPQPQWAKTTQAAVVGWVKTKLGSAP